MEDSLQPIKRKEKLAFFLTNVGNIPVMAMINAFLLVFYTDVVGLSPMSVGTLLLATKVFDSFNDPVTGFIIDHLPRTKLGRFRSTLLFGSVICGLNFLLLWFGPLWAPAGKLAIAYVSYILIGITFDFMDIPLNSMIPVMTSDLSERTSLASIKGMGYILGAGVFTIVSPIIVDKYEASATGYIIVIFAAAATVIAFSVFGALGIRERVMPIAEEKYRVKDLPRLIFTRPVFFSFLATLLYSVGMNAMKSASMYYVRYILDDISALSLSTAIMSVGIVPAALLTGLFTKKLGKKRTYALGVLVFALSFLVRLFDVYSKPLLLASCAVNGFGSGFIMLVSYSIQADNVDNLELKTGIRAEGAVASLTSFVNKAGSAFGTAIPAFVLDKTGYVANAAQTATAARGILFANIHIPSLLTFVAFLVFIFGYNLTDGKVREVVEELNRRRGAAAVPQEQGIRS